MAKFLIVSAWKCADCHETYIYWREHDVPKYMTKIKSHEQSHSAKLRGTFHTFFIPVCENKIPPAGRFGGD